jgi:CspA family cold shock protein
MTKGTVKWYNADKGMGFITWIDKTQRPSSQDILVSREGLDPRMGGKLAEDEKVEFDILATRKGPQAVNVRRYSAE